MSQKTLVCQVDDIMPETGVCALVGNQHVAVFRLKDDRVLALDNYDPFGQASVLSRGIVGCMNGERTVASPLHKQHLIMIRNDQQTAQVGFGRLGKCQKIRVAVTHFHDGYAPPLPIQ